MSRACRSLLKLDFHRFEPSFQFLQTTQRLDLFSIQPLVKCQSGRALHELVHLGIDDNDDPGRVPEWQPSQGIHPPPARQVVTD